jgi:hypothetical protein
MPIDEVWFTEKHAALTAEVKQSIDLLPEIAAHVVLLPEPVKLNETVVAGI